MFQRFLPTLAFAGLLAATAHADAHKWQISEIFSSADGTIQYVEWSNPDDDEEFLLFESVQTGSGKNFNFLTNLPSSFTGGRRFLMATPGYAALPGVPTPDYVIPSGFMNPNGDSLNYSGGDFVAFGPLPQDGRTSITRNGIPMASSPQNFTGDTGTVLLARATIRNGSGLNSLCYTASPPAIGGPWTASISTAAHPGAVAGYVYARLLPRNGPTIPLGELLVDLGSQFLFELTSPSVGGSANFGGAIPSDMALIGASLASQGVIFGGGVELCNAVDMVVGQ